MSWRLRSARHFWSSSLLLSLLLTLSTVSADDDGANYEIESDDRVIPEEKLTADEEENWVGITDIESNDDRGTGEREDEDGDDDDEGEEEELKVAYETNVIEDVAEERREGDPEEKESTSQSRDFGVDEDAEGEDDRRMRGKFQLEGDREERTESTKSPVTDMEDEDEDEDEELPVAEEEEEELMGIVAPPAQSQEESHPSATQKEDLISYKFLSWFIDKIRPEGDDAVDLDSAAAASAADRADQGAVADAIIGDAIAAPTASSSIAKDDETADGGASSQDSTGLPAASQTEALAEQNDTRKCSGFGCILKLSQKAKTIKCAPRNMTILEKKREGATLDDLTRVHIFLTQGRINDALKHRKPEQAPHVNALARAFPLLEVGAIDATLHRSVAHKFGVAGVPSLVLFQNNKMVAKLNDTEGIDTSDFEKIVKSVASMTGLTANESVVVEDADYEGPLKSDLVEQTDLYLVLSWIFLILYAILKLLRSDYGRSIRQSLLLHLTIWREVAENAGREGHHPHAD